MKRVLVTIGFLVGCNSATPTHRADAGGAPDSCPRAGTVPANLRDVERDAEGVSYSAFGEFPTRAPDWKRAAGVLSLLKEVWDSAQHDCPNLPSDAVGSVDSALAQLDIAIPAQDQSAAARAGNDVHLQMAPLFAYFNPTTPIEVVRMDATFLRAGVHAHFGEWSDFDTDLRSLQSDWSSLRGAAAARVPTCHRVAGTASVVTDVDETLRKLEAARGADAATAETESDAGLLEVDILELLFDCPPDAVVPHSGLGSACKQDSVCGNHEVCDLENSGGRCAPAPETALVGEGCATTVDCGSDARAACNNEVGDGFPGGYCSLEPCNDVETCPPLGTCVAMPFETPACMRACKTDKDCRTAEGYVCQLFPTAPPTGFGPSEYACAFPCTQDEDCTVPLKCAVATGRCTP